VEPVPSPSDRTGSPASGPAPLDHAIALARSWAGEERLATIVAGSHADGSAVWTRDEGRPVSLSDLDLYVVMPSERSRDAARARAAADRAGLAARLLAIGFAAPLEVGFHTPPDLERLPARPGTLELRRRGRVVEGDPSWLARVPAWEAREVSGEEVLLLLENRGFELLWAESMPADGRALTALRRRHAVLKAALDLAAVITLAAGEYPETAAARVAWARSRRERARTPEPPWDEALAWRAGEVRALEPALAEAERVRTVRAWVAVWRSLSGAGAGGDPFRAARGLARRARLRRRLRWGVLPGSPEARLEPWTRRARLAPAGTPRHRLHAAAAAHLVLESAAGAGADRALERDYRRTMRALGAPAADPARAARGLVEAWDRGLHDGQRTEGWS
jgi:predicted nucleotidyltransferase